MVDEGKLGMRTAVELSYLPEQDQKTLFTAIDSEQAPPSMSQAQRLRKLSKAGELNDDTALEIMRERHDDAGSRDECLRLRQDQGLFPQELHRRADGKNDHESSGRLGAAAKP